MRVAITGASGFIGKAVLEELIRYEGIEILALSRNCISNITESRVEWKKTDYTIESLEDIMDNIDVIIHLAAVRGTQGVISDYYDNEKITENLLIVMAKKSISHIVFGSSIAVYSDTTRIPWNELMPLSPKTLYGITKASCEYLCAFYAKKYGYTYNILRIAQVLGVEERRKGMMNNFIKLAHEGKKLTVVGESNARRQYIYIQDLAEAIAVCAIQKSGESKIINIGMQVAYTNLEIAEIVNKVFENKVSIEYQQEKNENIESSYMDIELYMKYLNLYPKTLDEALFSIREEMVKSV
ncbi:NAD-dependent epimerase/dehydratase family protein [Mediterraneibacter gnavus]|uniref:NAD-dependent epimerase/dehydratase family protein n=1 Tax=Mediterraneibacter gnavus TaxID=33038 RepID=UPI00232AAF74|nr:NAD(P)-dependent oxidoreductase [Mediterraneibacter gnavus]MDB8711940.1 NAD(P)-dependent oxidoreductase [Mediterraneibacter gnavus]MDB8714966.1 NAD(P)-dependent oxidoreductase [Mediterraneibacter gnavus]